MIYHYKLGGFRIHLILLYILTVMFLVPYWTLSFINTLGEESRSYYKLQIFRTIDVDFYFIFTMIFRLIISLVACVTFLMLRHRDVVLEKFRKMQTSQNLAGNVT